MKSSAYGSSLLHLLPLDPKATLLSPPVSAPLRLEMGQIDVASESPVGDVYDPLLAR